MSVKIAIFDYDGTLINNTEHMSFGDGKFDWETFLTNSLSSPTNNFVAKQIKELQSQGYTVLICTARPEAFEDFMIQDLTERNFGEDMLIMRDDLLWQDELHAISDIECKDEVRKLIMEHHAKYRSFVIEDLEKQYGVGCIHYAFDDQKHNVDEFVKKGVVCGLVDNDKQTMTIHSNPVLNYHGFI